MPGILQPELRPPHMLTKPVSVAKPPAATPALLHAPATGRASTPVTDALVGLTSPAVQQEFAQLLESVTRWSELGCDLVAPRHLSRLGKPIERICYARGSGLGTRTASSVSLRLTGVPPRSTATITEPVSPSRPEYHGLDH
jgi:hypothetical protein